MSKIFPIRSPLLPTLPVLCFFRSGPLQRCFSEHFVFSFPFFRQKCRPAMFFCLFFQQFYKILARKVGWFEWNNSFLSSTDCRFSSPSLRLPLPRTSICGSKRQKTTNATIQEVAVLIRQGANTFMRREYKVLAKFAAVAAVVILVLLPAPIWQGEPLKNVAMALSYIAGPRCFRPLPARSASWWLRSPTPGTAEARAEGH